MQTLRHEIDLNSFQATAPDDLCELDVVVRTAIKSEDGETWTQATVVEIRAVEVGRQPEVDRYYRRTEARDELHYWISNQINLGG